MVRIDPLSGIPLPTTTFEIAESIALLGWHPAQLKFLFDFKGEDDCDGPAGFYVEISGPTVPEPPTWALAVLNVDGSALDQEEVDRRLSSLVTCGFKLPLVGPIISYGWTTRESLDLALQDVINGKGDAFIAA